MEWHSQNGQRRAVSANRPAWVKLYNTAAWKRIRRAQLLAEPLCAFCLERGTLTPATVCDHVTAHKGDERLFYGGPFQSLCKTCHDGAKQAQDKSGKRRGCDATGKPHGRQDWRPTYGQARD